MACEKDLPQLINRLIEFQKKLFLFMADILLNSWHVGINGYP